MGNEHLPSTYYARPIYLSISTARRRPHHHDTGGSVGAPTMTFSDEPNIINCIRFRHQRTIHPSGCRFCPSLFPSANHPLLLSGAATARPADDDCGTCRQACPDQLCVDGWLDRP